jgi:hypothetical protein
MPGLLEQNLNGGRPPRKLYPVRCKRCGSLLAPDPLPESVEVLPKAFNPL